MPSVLSVVLSALVALMPYATSTEADATSETEELPKHLYGGAWDSGHVQGIAIDEQKQYMYYSFTDMLVKTDLHGNVIGTVTGLTGHLGDLDYNPEDGRVYGSLEYKDAEAFYVAIVDVDAIDREGMDAEDDGIVSTVYLDEVVEDFTADMDGDRHFDGDVADTADHRYGCSGIDGISFGPEFGTDGGEEQLMVAYGVYSNTEREDNDHQVILQYDTSDWADYERPLSQTDPHTSGPDEVDAKYFTYTGNTTYGVQNLEYDAHTGNWFMAVYPGEKQEFPNYSFFVIDGSRPAEEGTIRGQRDNEQGLLLTLLEDGEYDEASETYGWEFDGQYGLISLGNGYYYVSMADTVEEDGITKETSDVYLYSLTGQTPTPFDRVASDSDTRVSVVIGGQHSGVENRPVADGSASVNDVINADGEWSTHGAFVRHVTEVSRDLVDDDVLTSRERASIVAAAAASDVGR